ncbi:hypothetical protein QQS21_008133 [Conoideocrella luteorostrata]|uniref:Uncharacterized protein n=1 Tax=Conoideocrella luteorostrata TaxID=1105319 RepID=A0AAJ0FW96_9HYPO|nr:hypothetical protein QQS21_008133 [Conoideocrella luteorostrata]
MDPEDGATTGIMTGFEEENTFKNADVADVGTQYAQDHDEGAGFELQDELSNEIPQPGSSLTDHRLLWAQWVVENTDAVFQNSNNTRSSTHENDTNASLIGYQHYWQSASPARVRETSELSFSTQPDSAAFAHRGAFPRSSLPRNDAAPFQEDNRWLNTPTELQPGFVHEHPSSFVPLNAATPGTRLTLPCITVSPSPMSLHYPAVNMLSGMPYYSARTPQQSAGGLVMQPSYDQFLDNSAGAYTATSQSALSDEAYTYLSEVCGSQAELQSNTNLTSHATSSPWTPSEGTTYKNRKRCVLSLQTAQGDGE